MKIFLFFVGSIFVISCSNVERMNFQHTLTCKSSICIYDSVVTAMRDSVFSISYYKDGKTIWFETYEQDNDGNYYYVNSVLDFNGDSIGSYNYLMFAPIDTVFFFSFDSLGYPPVRPLNSDAWQIRISRKGPSFEVEKRHAYLDSFSTFIKFDYPLRVSYIITQNTLGVSRFE